MNQRVISHATDSMTEAAEWLDSIIGNRPEKFDEVIDNIACFQVVTNPVLNDSQFNLRVIAVVNTR